VGVHSPVIGGTVSERLVLLGTVVTAISGVPGLFAPRRSMAGQWITTLIAVLGATLGLLGIATYWATGISQPISVPWSIPGANFQVAMDGLSAIFLMPIFVISLLGGVYGVGYWNQLEHPDNGRKLRLFYGTMTAGMGLLVIARDGILFLYGWEIMAFSAFFLITTEDNDAEVRQTGWIYMISTHTATLCLFGLFALLRAANGSFALSPVPEGSLSPGGATAVFALAIAAFGLKAGVMPLHVWLPSAHAITPSHVSAIMSGVIIKMGIYGLARVTSLIPNPPLAWGYVVLGLGVVSGVVGVAYAIGQHDLKRLLAYHSIENIGIILIGLGLALVGRSLGRSDLVVLGLGGALLHVWNHALFKALLFLSAGSVVHAVHTREIDRMGGLAKSMPWTSLCFLIGAVAICGLPPLNGFVSELLIYVGLFSTFGTGVRSAPSWAAFAAPALALIGGLAAACFVKVHGVVFLGSARSESGDHARESGPVMIGPMIVLAACCFLIGLAPLVVSPAIARGVFDWAPGLGLSTTCLSELAPLGWITLMGFALIAALSLGAAALRIQLGAGRVQRGPTWGCGYVAPTPRMQYTSSSFAQMLVWMFGWVLRPRSHKPADLPLFARTAAFHGETPDVVLDQVVLPTFRFVARLCSWCRVFQQGNIQIYLLYIFLALIVLLLWR
jgi:hydrogenase-4 component B